MTCLRELINNFLNYLFFLYYCLDNTSVMLGLHALLLRRLKGQMQYKPSHIQYIDQYSIGLIHNF